MADRYTYLSSGLYRDTQTGKTVKSTTNPNKSAPASSGDGRSGSKGQTPILKPGTQINNASQATEAERAVQQQQAQDNLQINNPNQVNPFGSQTVTYDEQGRPTVTTGLSKGQQGIADSNDALSNMGRDLAKGNLQGSQLGTAFNPNLMARYGADSLEANRAKVEDAVYKRLTKNLDYRQGLEKQDVEQQLANRGIPYSNDPNSQYQQQMKDFNDRYDNIRADAMNSAVVSGGDEYSRNVGINETQRANDFTLQSGQRNQQLNESGQLANFGAGLQNPNYTQFQGTQLNYGSPTAADAAFKQLANQRLQISKSGGGGGGGATNSTSTTASVFG